MNLKYGVVAKAANMAQDGSMNIDAVCCRIRIANLPEPYPSFAVVLILCTDTADWRKVVPITMRLLDPDGELIIGTTASATPSPEACRVGLMAWCHTLTMVTFAKRGWHWFEVTIGGNPCPIRIELEVTTAEKAQQHIE